VAEGRGADPAAQRGDGRAGVVNSELRWVCTLHAALHADGGAATGAAIAAARAAHARWREQPVPCVGAAGRPRRVPNRSIWHWASGSTRCRRARGLRAPARRPANGAHLTARHVERSLVSAAANRHPTRASC